MVTIQDKVCIITGGAGSIGLASAALSTGSVFIADGGMGI